MEDVEGKVAFITGGASGLGLGMAKAFVKAGMKVVIADIRQDHIDAATAWFAERQIRGVHAIQLDVTDRAAYARAADEAEQVFGKIHVLCNNAGMGVGGSIRQTGFDDWDWGVGVLLGGVTNGITIILPRILKHGEGGHIVNTSSTSALVPDGAIYATCKSAVLGLSEAIRLDLAADNIGVSAFCPGPTKSNIHQSGRTRPEKFKADTKLLDWEAKLEQRVASPLWMEADEVGEIVLDGIRRNKLFILTHPEFREGTKERFQTLLDSFPDREVDPEKASQLGFPIRSPIYAAGASGKKQLG